MTRRAGILTKSIAIICAALLIPLPGSVAWAQGSVFGHEPESGWQKAKLSQAIVNDADRAVENVITANQAGRLTASDLDIAATSLQILWDHFQEIGLNDALQKEILNNQEEFLQFHPDDAQVAAYSSHLFSHGVRVSSSRLQSVMDPDFEARQEFLSTVQRVGLYRAEMAAVAQLREQARQLNESVNSGRELPMRYAPQRAPHLIRVMTPVCGACFILAGIGLASGCTLTVAACGASLGTCLTCALGG